MQYAALFQFQKFETEISSAKKSNSVPAIVLIVALSFVLCSCTSLDYRRIRKQGEPIIAKIEAFKKEKGRLPDNLAEIGVKVDEGGPIFYEKKSASSYKIWGVYGGEWSYTYDSETKEWK